MGPAIPSAPTALGDPRRPSEASINVDSHAKEHLMSLKYGRRPAFLFACLFFRALPGWNRCLSLMGGSGANDLWLATCISAEIGIQRRECRVSWDATAWSPTRRHVGGVSGARLAVDSHALAGTIDKVRRVRRGQGLKEWVDIGNAEKGAGRGGGGGWGRGAGGQSKKKKSN